MSFIENSDPIYQSLKIFSLEDEIKRLEAMPRQIYNAFISFHKSLPPRTASGAINWESFDSICFEWECEEFFPTAFLNEIKINNYNRLGIVYSMDFDEGYIFCDSIDKMNINILALCNGPAFAFGISDDNNADFSSLLELRWPSTFTAMRKS